MSERILFKLTLKQARLVRELLVDATDESDEPHVVLGAMKQLDRAFAYYGRSTDSTPTEGES